MVLLNLFWKFSPNRKWLIYPFNPFKIKPTEQDIKEWIWHWLIVQSLTILFFSVYQFLMSCSNCCLISKATSQMCVQPNENCSFSKPWWNVISYKTLYGSWQTSTFSFSSFKGFKHKCSFSVTDAKTVKRCRKIALFNNNKATELANASNPQHRFYKMCKKCSCFEWNWIQNCILHVS